jgi:alpha-L-fucosidase 2
MSIPLGQKAYQAFGNLHVRHIGLDGTVSAYRRDLDLDRAVATTRFEVDGTTYTRDVFASHPDGVLVVRITADRPGEVGLAVSLTSAHEGAARHAVGGDQLSMSGGVEEGAVRFEARLRVQAEGGEVTLADTVATVSGADAVTLILSGATNFVRYDDVSADPAARNDDTLAALGDASFGRIALHSLRGADTTGDVSRIVCRS